MDNISHFKKLKYLFIITSYSIFLSACTPSLDAVLEEGSEPTPTPTPTATPTPSSTPSPTPTATPTPTPSPTPTPMTCNASTVNLAGDVLNSAGVSGQSIYVSGNYAYMGVSGVTTGIQVVNISNPSSPSNVAFIDTTSGVGQIDPSSNDVLDITGSGNYIYASTYSGGLLVVDVTDPNSPSIVGTLDIVGETWSIGVKSNYVFLGNLTSGLIVVDVTQKNNPVVLNTVAGMTLRHLQIENNTIYGSGSDTLQIIDITTPAAPTLTGSLAVPAMSAYESFYRSGYMYTVDKGNKTLLTYDVTNPSSISLVNTSAAGTNDYRSIAGFQDKIYVGTGAGVSGDVVVYDLTNPAAPTLEYTQAISHRAYEIYFDNGRVYSANGDGKLQITNVCTP